jgi:LysR family transcriptional regulator, glycine cleavage system transcriptional activator
MMNIIHVYLIPLNMRRIPNFVLLRAFEAAARLESFTLAAQELNLTQSAISHQVKELEEFFDKKLFVRRNRRVEPTSEGRRLLENLSRVFDVIEAACNEVGLAPESEVLALHCAPSFAINWLGPRLPSFVAKHPNITIRITTDSEPVDLTQARELDFGISYGPPHKRSGVISTALGVERIAPLCSPKLINKKKTVRDQLPDLALIDSKLGRIMWPSWFSLNGMKLPSKPRASFDRAALVIAAAVDGLGVALESTRLAEKELERGNLIDLAQKDFLPIEQETHFAYYRSNEQQLEKIKVFKNWLYTEAGIE